MPDPASALARLARRLAGDPEFMAAVLTAYQTQHRLDPASLANELGLTPLALTRLALCRRPQASEPEFAAAVRQIADYTGVAAVQLAQIIRQVDALEAMSRWPQTEPGLADAREPRIAPFGPGLLAAARDREPDPENPPADIEGDEDDETPAT